MMISGGRTKQLDTFCRVTGFTSDFFQFRSCGTYLVLSLSPSVSAKFGITADNQTYADENITSFLGRGKDNDTSITVLQMWQ